MIASLVMKSVSFLSTNNSIQFMTYMARNVPTSIPTFFAEPRERDVFLTVKQKSQKRDLKILCCGLEDGERDHKPRDGETTRGK